MTLNQFLARAQALSFLDRDMVPEVKDWPKFRDHPLEYFMSARGPEREHIWQAADSLDTLLAVTMRAKL